MTRQQHTPPQDNSNNNSTWPSTSRNPQKKQEAEFRKDENDANTLPWNTTIDVVAILVACQLLGLLDALNRPDFPGWLAPIDNMSTLPRLVQRVSFNGSLWILASTTTNSSSRNSSTNNNKMPKLSSSFLNPPDNKKNTNDPWALSSMYPTRLSFALLRVGGAWIVVAASSNSSMGPLLLEALREVYTIALITVGARLILGSR